MEPAKSCRITNYIYIMSLLSTFKWHMNAIFMVIIRLAVAIYTLYDDFDSAFVIIITAQQVLSLAVKSVKQRRHALLSIIFY